MWRRAHNAPLASGLCSARSGTTTFPSLHSYNRFPLRARHSSQSLKISLSPASIEPISTHPRHHLSSSTLHVPSITSTSTAAAKSRLQSASIRSSLIPGRWPSAARLVPTLRSRGPSRFLTASQLSRGGSTGSCRLYTEQLQNRTEKIERIVQGEQQPKRRFKLTTDLKYVLQSCTSPCSTLRSFHGWLTLSYFYCACSVPLVGLHSSATSSWERILFDPWQ